MLTAMLVLDVSSGEVPATSCQSTGPSFTHWLKLQHDAQSTSACDLFTVSFYQDDGPKWGVRLRRERVGERGAAMKTAKKVILA